MSKRRVDAMKLSPFSVNIDECTSNNYQKVVTIHVNYFDEKSCLSVLLYKFVSMIE